MFRPCKICDTVVRADPHSEVLECERAGAFGGGVACRTW